MEQSTSSPLPASQDTDTPITDGARELLRRLTSASPAEKSRLLLDGLQRDPGVMLQAGSGERLVLTGIDLSPASLSQVAGSGQPPPWLHPETGGIVIRGLRASGGSLRSSNLSGAHLDDAVLAGADLCGAQLDSAVMTGADLRDALLEESSLRAANLRFADLSGAALECADLSHADLWGARLVKSCLVEASLPGGVLREANLSGADLSGANLRGADLRQACLSGARLAHADLRDALLDGADLSGAYLRGANLERLDLSTCTVRGVHLGGVRLDRTLIRQAQLGGALGDELAGDAEDAQLGYLALELNFIALADPAGADWAYLRKRRMQKLAARTAAGRMRQGGHLGAALVEARRYLSLQLAEWVCDYGLGLGRVAIAILLVDVLFFALYALTGSVVRTGAGVTRAPLDLLVFTMLGMTNSSAGQGIAPVSAEVHILTTLQALLCLFLVGLAGFVLGNRIRR